MFMSKLPPVPKKTKKIAVGASPVAIDTNSRHCMLEVLAGSLYVSGDEDKTVSADSFKIPAGTIFEFTGLLNAVSDASGADVRLLFYETL